MNIVGKRNWYFAFSLLVIIPGVISLLLWGLNLSIDFTGGTEISLSFPRQVNQQIVSEVRKSFAKQKIEIISLQQSANQIAVRTKPIDNKQDATLLDDVQKN